MKKRGVSPRKNGAYTSFYISFLLVGYLSGVGIFSVILEAVDACLAHRVEDPVLDALVALLKLGEQILHILALRGVILGAE